MNAFISTSFHIFIILGNVNSAPDGPPFPSQVEVSVWYANLNLWYSFCNGVLIALNKVVAPADCVPYYYPPEDVRVSLGKVDKKYQQIIYVSRVDTHKDYEWFEWPNDIALITLSTPAKLDKNVQVAKLAVNSSSIYVETSCMIYSWGGSRVEQVSRTLLSKKECLERAHDDLWYPLSSGLVTCVFSRKGDNSAPCMGNLGTPLLCGPNKDTLVGIAKMMAKYCVAGQPSFYTDVTSHLAWLQQRMY
ncbi:trypsin [Biomphalaria pfeifferi]|uniref:Trypsin n=1 Tax=Biomphalaria pfeifferi TaxID=112525 RepID=A0AAD8C3D5_BIOPF|nr:trypsin [Biomphalaria pfeifferi]